MAACDSYPAQMTNGSKRASRSSSKASCRSGNGRSNGGAQAACGSGSQSDMPNYMKPLSRTPSYSARINIGGGGLGGTGCSFCPGHPRPDCCKVPCAQKCLPKCPLGIYAERVESMKPNRVYEPPETKFDGLSTYREHYFHRCADKIPSYKPFHTFVPSEAKMDGITQYKFDYTGCMVPPPASYKKQTTFVPSEAKMDGITQYRFDYTGCMVPREPSYKKQTTFVPSDAKLEGITTYRLNYIPYCPREYDYAKGRPTGKPIGSPSCAPMDGISTYRTDYYPKCAVKINSMKPSLKPRFSDARMDGITTYKMDYIPFHFDKCRATNCVPAEIYPEMYPDPCLFGCKGDEKKGDEYEDPCPPNPLCVGNASCDTGGGLAPGCCETKFPWTVGNAGEQTRDCAKCLDDPPPEKDEEDC